MWFQKSQKKREKKRKEGRRNTDERTKTKSTKLPKSNICSSFPNFRLMSLSVYLSNSLSISNMILPNFSSKSYAVISRVHCCRQFQLVIISDYQKPSVLLSRYRHDHNQNSTAWLFQQPFEIKIRKEPLQIAEIWTKILRQSFDTSKFTPQFERLNSRFLNLFLMITESPPTKRKIRALLTWRAYLP